ncbi:AAA family ATPase [Desulfobacterales bacterium HSG2]|nr:AAA family ATPase [Desulfobacterales bacterium HSG2]
MKIKELKLTSFESLSIDMDGQLTVLIAPNGAGKTALLDALGLGPFVSRFSDVSGINPSKDKYLRIRDDGSRAPYMRIGLELTNGVAWDRTGKRDSTERTKQQIPQALGLTELYRYADKFIHREEDTEPPSLPIIAYYGTGRGVFDTRHQGRPKKRFWQHNAYDGALDARASFKKCFDLFYQLEDYERRGREKKRDWNYQLPPLDSVRKAIERMLPEFANPRSEVRPLRFVIDWKQDQLTRTHRIDQLSDGYRTTLAMVMDIASRMTEASLAAEDILSTEGVVLIDEVELHLHLAADYPERSDENLSKSSVHRHNSQSPDINHGDAGADLYAWPKCRGPVCRGKTSGRNLC